MLTIIRSIVVLPLLVVLLLCRSSPVGGYEKFKVDDLEIKLGDSEGLSPSSSISAETLQKILKGVESGNKDNIYFYGLLKLYGISLSKEPEIAAQNFLRASNLGHMEATTAYGVMLMSGTGIAKDDMAAAKFFRKGVERGDMVCTLQCHVEWQHPAPCHISLLYYYFVIYHYVLEYCEFCINISFLFCYFVILVHFRTLIGYLGSKCCSRVVIYFLTGAIT